MVSVGYVKDGVAAIMFLILILFVYVTQKVPIRNTLVLLSMAVVVDGLFTLNKDWHCEDWEDSKIAKYIVLAQIPVFFINIPI